MSIALATTWEDRLTDLGNISAARVRVEPTPGKRREYFHAGVELLWMVDHRSRTVTVFRSAQNATVAKVGERLDGGSVLPGWQVDISELFSRLDRNAASE